jgi:hypothetical protein
MQDAQLIVIRDAYTADTSERLRKSADHEIDLRQDALILGAAQARGAVGAE